MSGDCRRFPGLGGGNRDGGFSQRNGVFGSLVPSLRKQPRHSFPGFVRPRSYHRRCHRLLSTLSYQPGQCRNADSCESRRHHVASLAVLDLDDTLRIDRQTRLGCTPDYRLLRTHHATLGVDRQEEQVYERRTVLRLDTCHRGDAHQQVNSTLSNSWVAYRFRIISEKPIHYP